MNTTTTATQRSAPSPLLSTATIEALVKTHGSPLLVLDWRQLDAQYARLHQALPGVRLHYAIKALPDPAVIQRFDALGSGFDVASNGEIELLQAAGVSPRACIHSHPIKRTVDIVRALRFGCTTFVVDNPDEIDKLVPYRDRVGVLLRVAFRATDAVCDLSRKFGCDPDAVVELLRLARRRGVHIKGLSFHVGSQVNTPTAMAAAIRRCGEIIRTYHASQDGHRLSVLDIGGGFPANYDGTSGSIDTFCAPIRRALARLPAPLHIIAEPGRYLVASAVTSIATVIGRATRGDRPWYYLDDGVYGSFSGQIYDHARYPITVVPRSAGHTGAPMIASVLAGPTCDSIDVIAEDMLLPPLAPGDLVVTPMMGAYTLASASRFNSIEPAALVVLPLNDDVTAAAPMRA